MSLTNPKPSSDSAGMTIHRPADDATRPIPRHLLSVIVEDYFQVGAFQKWIDPSQWSRLESRLEANVERTLEFLGEHETKATFFILGWNARRFPLLMRRIADAGHEVASGGMLHRRLETFTPDTFRDDVRESRDCIEQASQQPVLGYRLAEGWIGPHDHWVQDVLAKEGFAYDSSLLYRGWSWSHNPRERQAHRVTAKSGPIWELPPATYRLPWFDLPIAGGNYFRQIPRPLIQWLMSRQAQAQQSPLMLYFHVWELDVEQPHVTAAGRINRVRHYRNLAKMRQMLPEFLKQYSFGSVRDWLSRVDSETWELRESQRMQQMSLPDWSENAGRAETIQIPGTIWALANAVPPTKGSLPGRAVVSPREFSRTPVTIVIPCYNEAQTLPFLSGTVDAVENALSDQYQVEFLFIDDGSSDATWELLNQHFGSRPGCRCIRHEVNQGITAAVFSGLKAARTEIVCTIDCDCSYDPLELKQMIPLLTADVDVVTASPYHPDGGVRNVPGWRLSLSAGASWLYRRVLRSPLHTFTSCFRVYRRSSVVGLPVCQTGFLGMAEILGQVLLRNGRVVEHPAVLNVRLFGASKMKTLRTIAGHLGLMSRLLKQRLFGSRHQSPTIHIETPVAPAASEFEAVEQVAV
jgi:polysaccharide deacetylase family protein (PEP-CTERM system associated)